VKHFSFFAISPLLGNGIEISEEFFALGSDSEKKFRIVTNKILPIIVHLLKLKLVKPRQ